MTIHDRNLKAGTVLTAPDKYTKDGKPRTCTLVEVDGKLVFELDNGTQFASITMAGRDIDDSRRNGWAFWSRDGDTAPPKGERVSKKASKADQIKAETAAYAERGGAAITPKGGTKHTGVSATYMCADCGTDVRPHAHSHTAIGEFGLPIAVCCPCAQLRGHDCPLVANERLAATAKEKATSKPKAAAKPKASTK